MINKERINAISLECKARIIAEIGADHGFITKNLFETNKIDFAYCTDISAKCLDKARKNLSMFNGKVEFLVGNGLDVFSCNIMNDDYLAFLSFRKQAAFASKARQSLPCLSGAKVAYYLMQGKYIKEIFL